VVAFGVGHFFSHGRPGSQVVDSRSCQASTHRGADHHKKRHSGVAEGYGAVSEVVSLCLFQLHNPVACPGAAPSLQWGNMVRSEWRPP
jgi:hypothetical protein